MLWLVSLPWLGDVALLLLRLVIGGMFVLSGYFKLTDPKRRHMVADSLAKAGMPAGLAVPLATVELVGGLSVLAGLLTVAGAAVLLAVSIGALLTTTWPNAEGKGIHKFENLLYSPEAIIGAALLVLLAIGAGGWSIDATLLRH